VRSEEVEGGNLTTGTYLEWFWSLLSNSILHELAWMFWYCKGSWCRRRVPANRRDCANSPLYNSRKSSCRGRDRSFVVPHFDVSQQTSHSLSRVSLAIAVSGRLCAPSSMPPLIPLIANSMGKVFCCSGSATSILFITVLTNRRWGVRKSIDVSSKRITTIVIGMISDDHHYMRPTPLLV
jgi:hypothetical protein